MELTAASMSATTYAQSLDIDNPSPPQAWKPAIEPRIFTETISHGDTRVAPIERLANPAESSVGGNAPVAPGNDDSGRVKRDLNLSACSGTPFRECRGGVALDRLSRRNVRFDQFNQARTRGYNGAGTCQGIARVLMRDIDASAGEGGHPMTLGAATSNMNIDINSGQASAPGGLYDRIDALQGKNAPFRLTNYHPLNEGYKLTGNGQSRTQRIDGMQHAIQDIPPGGVAYIRIGIQPAGAMGAHEENGHILLVQRSPDGVEYTIFDPNNGAFIYNNSTDAQTSLNDYMATAYTEDGDTAAPDDVQFYVPNTYTGISRPVPTTPEFPDVLPEPSQLLHHVGFAGGDGQIMKR